MSHQPQEPSRPPETIDALIADVEEQSEASVLLIQSVPQIKHNSFVAIPLFLYLKSLRHLDLTMLEKMLTASYDYIKVVKGSARRP